MMVSSRISSSNTKIPSNNKIIHQIFENKQVDFINYCSKLSCFIIITCSTLSLFMAYQNSSMFFHINKIPTLDVEVINPVNNAVENPSLENSNNIDTIPTLDDVEKNSVNAIENPSLENSVEISIIDEIPTRLDVEKNPVNAVENPSLDNPVENSSIFSNIDKIPTLNVEINPVNAVENPSLENSNIDKIPTLDVEINPVNAIENPSLENSNIDKIPTQNVEINPVNAIENPSVENPVENSSIFQDNNAIENPSVEKPDECVGKYIYVLDVPKKFNIELLEKCETLNPWTNACRLLQNYGLGPELEFPDDTVFSGSNWFNTDQWSLEVIIHYRLKQYKCLTNDYSKASAVYIPYYPGLDVGRYLWTSNVTLRDEGSVELVKIISRKPEWARFGGRDHFLIAGRMTWDFSRGSDNLSEPSAWGNRLLHLPEIKNVTTLLLESRNIGSDKTDFAIPYPTYFHPSGGNEVGVWQEKMRAKNRVFLFSFAGAPRPQIKESIRNVLIDQCLAAQQHYSAAQPGKDCVQCLAAHAAQHAQPGKNCDQYCLDAAAQQQPGKNCEYVHTGADVKPETVMGLFQKSVFCLQPPGDSLTRKSFFDTIIAGCIPVLFHPGSAYEQYKWHLPQDYSSYSVFIPSNELMQGKVSIEKVLLGFSMEKIRAMRENVIKLIPRIVYANPNTEIEDFEDAFDVAIKGVLQRVEGIKMEMERGKIDSSRTV